jgi:hypothetical protein
LKTVVYEIICHASISKEKTGKRLFYSITESLISLMGMSDYKEREKAPGSLLILGRKF